MVFTNYTIKLFQNHVSHVQSTWFNTCNPHISYFTCEHTIKRDHMCFCTRDIHVVVFFLWGCLMPDLQPKFSPRIIKFFPCVLHPSLCLYFPASVISSRYRQNRLILLFCLSLTHTHTHTHKVYAMSYAAICSCRQKIAHLQALLKAKIKK